MKTYKEAFSQLNRAALIPFFVIGDPDFETSLEIVKTAIDSGADVLELGIPFSDPIADGPVIQKADIRSMKSGMKIAKALDFISKIKEYKDIPIGLLMYYNLVFQYGIEKFFIDCHKAGVNSVLVADLSIDDSEEISGAAISAGLDTELLECSVLYAHLAFSADLLFSAQCFDVRTQSTRCFNDADSSVYFTPAPGRLKDDHGFSGFIHCSFLNLLTILIASSTASPAESA